MVHNIITTDRYTLIPMHRIHHTFILVLERHSHCFLTLQRSLLRSSLSRDTYALPEQLLAGRIRHLILVKPHWRGKLVKLHVKVQENVGHESFQLVDSEESSRTAHQICQPEEFSESSTYTHHCARPLPKKTKSRLSVVML